MAENGNVNLVLGKALSVLPEAELFEPVRNPLHRNSADFPLASTPAGGSFHILLAKDCSRSRIGAHAVQWSSADIATVHAMSALGQKQTFAPHQPMSALPPKADVCGATRDVRYKPIAGIRHPMINSWARINHRLRKSRLAAAPPRLFDLPRRIMRRSEERRVGNE